MILDGFKQKLKNKQNVYGVFMKSSDPMLDEILGFSGFDYAILDTEHGPTDIQSQQNNIRACELRGVVPIIRVPYIDENVIGKALDIGAAGIQISQIRTADDVKRVIKYAKFYPLGERGVCRFVRAADYSSKNREKFFKDENDKIIIIQLEGTEAIANLDEILDIEGYDIIFIGPYDLSQSLGIPGQIDNPKVLNAMIDIVERAKSKGKVIGTFTDSYDMVDKWKKLGVQYISYSTDSGLFYDICKNTINQLVLTGQQSVNSMILDCTLSDGGFVNKWKFGNDNIKKILKSLVASNVDFIECGILTNSANLSKDKSCYNSIKAINNLLLDFEQGNYLLMVNYGEYDIDDIPLYNGTGINGIRVSFYKNDLAEALLYCQKIKEKGYKVFIHAEISYGYLESEFIYFIQKCNEIKPFAIDIVDSFSSIKRNDLIKCFKIIDSYLDSDILVDVHFHNDMQLAFANIIYLLENSQRKIIIESSVHGMGMGAGNLNTELIMEYLNDNYLCEYKLKPILDINDVFIEKIYANEPWGYSILNYISAKYNCHPNYINYLSQKNNLTLEEINDIFSDLDNKKKMEFDKEYIEQLYVAYCESKDSKNDDFNMIKSIFNGKKVIMICPGKSSYTNFDKLKQLNLEEYIIISINFDYNLLNTDYIFVGNSRRMKEIPLDVYNKVIVSTNVPVKNVFARVNYSSLLNNTDYVKDNSGFMFLNLLYKCSVSEVLIIGMDGYKYKNSDNYITDEMMLVLQENTIEQINLGMKIELKNLKEHMDLKLI